MFEYMYPVADAGIGIRAAERTDVYEKTNQPVPGA